MPSQHELEQHPEYVKAIGMIALETVDLEIELSLLFSRMVRLPPSVGEAVYMTPNSEQARLEILQNTANALFAHHPRSKGGSARYRRKESLRTKVSRLVQRAKKCVGKRHRAVHDDWSVIPKTQEIHRIIVNGRGDLKSTPIELKQLLDEINDLRQLIDDVSALADYFSQHPPEMTGHFFRQQQPYKNP